MPKDDTFAGLLFEIKGKLGESSYDPSREIAVLVDADFPSIVVGFPETNEENYTGRGPNYFCRNAPTYTNVNAALKDPTFDNHIIAGYFVCRD